jgi:branched-chain amino acid transport system substrate-binding protein
LTQAAIAAHKKEYGSEPGAFFLNAYAATLAALHAIDKAGATDFAQVAKALRTEAVDTPLGSIRFDERGDAIGVGFAMYVVKGGAYQDVREGEE